MWGLELKYWRNTGVGVYCAGWRQGSVRFSLSCHSIRIGGTRVLNVVAKRANAGGSVGGTQRGPGAEPLVRGRGAPLKLKDFLLF